MKIITICASVSAYESVIRVMHQLENLGYKVIVPDLALEMESNHDFDFLTYVDRFNDQDIESKHQAILSHFPNLRKADAILVVNEPKRGLDGYIGPNVLMEMAVSLYLKKPIYLMNPPDKKVAGFDEIMGIKPIILSGNLQNLK